MDSRKLSTILLSFFLLALLVSTGCTDADTVEGEEGENAKVVINHSGSTRDCITNYDCSGEGKTYLIVDMTIRNKGYEEISTNPMYFEIVADNVKYDYSPSSLENGLDTVDIMNGGKAEGAIAFEVPKDVQDYSLQYEAWSDYNIEYNKK